MPLIAVKHGFADAGACQARDTRLPGLGLQLFANGLKPRNEDG